jgi:cytochrome c peroxidase
LILTWPAGASAARWRGGGGWPAREWRSGDERGIVFNGKGQCAVCHPPPFYTDLTMHDLMVDRFFTFRTVNNQIQKPDGLIKTFPLRGLKDSPPYFHDGRLFTLEDTIEFFNLIASHRDREGRSARVPARALIG